MASLARSFGKTRREGAVELDLLGAQIAHVRERRVAGAVVVDRKAGPDALESRSTRASRSSVRSSVRSVISSTRYSAGIACRDQRFDLARELGIEEIDGGQVDRDVERDARSAPDVATARGGGLEHEAPDVADQPGLLGRRDELRRGEQPARGCCQRTSASTPRIAPVARSACGW